MRWTTTWWVALCAALGLGSVAEAQVYVQGSAQVQVQGEAHVHGGYAPAAAPAPAPTAGTVQGRGGFIGGELLVHGTAGDYGGAGGFNLPLRTGWELDGGLLPYLEVGANGTFDGSGGIFWLDLAAGLRWVLYNQTALAPFVGARVDMGWIEDDFGDVAALWLGGGVEGGLLFELNKFTAITAVARYTQYFLGSLGNTGMFGVGGGVIVFY